MHGQNEGEMMQESQFDMSQANFQMNQGDNESYQLLFNQMPSSHQTQLLN
jgi:hypothetical protein